MMLEVATAVGELLQVKNLAYGSSFFESGKIMAILYPKGIMPGQMEDALAVTRIIDKLFRIANNPTAMGESPWQDLAGYSILGVVRRDMKCESGAEGGADSK